MDNEKTTDELVITDDMMWKETGELVDKGIIFCCSWLMSEFFIPAAENYSDNRIFEIEDLYKDCCPECGSCNISDNDDDETDETDDETEGGAFVCDDCGAKFDDPNIVEPLEYWFVKDWLSYRLEQEGELIIKTDCTPDIWARCCSGQSITCDGVIWNIAKKDIKERWELESKYKK